jgi:hypothetical protein
MTFTPRRKNPRPPFELWLRAGSLLVMTGQAQLDWTHAIRSATSRSQPRVSLSYRTRAFVPTRLILSKAAPPRPPRPDPTAAPWIVARDGRDALIWHELYANDNAGQTAVEPRVPTEGELKAAKERLKSPIILPLRR